MRQWLMQKAWEWVGSNLYYLLLAAFRAMPTWMPGRHAYHRYIARRKATIIVRRYLPEIHTALEKLDTGTRWELHNYLTRLYAGLKQEGLAAPEYLHTSLLDDQWWKDLQRSYLHFMCDVATSSLPPLSLDQFKQEVRKREQAYVERPLIRAMEADWKRWGLDIGRRADKPKEKAGG